MYPTVYPLVKPLDPAQPLRKFAPEHFDQLAAFQNMVNRARVRCQDVADNEKILGYEDSWEGYQGIISELSECYSWVSKILP